MKASFRRRMLSCLHHLLRMCSWEVGYHILAYNSALLQNLVLSSASAAGCCRPWGCCDVIRSIMTHGIVALSVDVQAVGGLACLFVLQQQ